MKQINLAIFLTLFINVLCLPLWTECDYVGFVRTLFNKEARLDLAYSGVITRAEPFQYNITPIPSYASWKYEADNIHRVNLSMRTMGKWQKLSLQLKAQRDGKITMRFRGPEVRDEYSFLNSVLTDWQNIKINGETVLPNQEAFSFKKNFTKQLSVKNGDVLHIEAEFRRHHFSIHDFTWLKSGKIWYVITGNLLVFFLIYRLLSCVRGIEYKKKIDVLLLAIFFPMLFIPMLSISDAVFSEREWRKLTTKPVLEDTFKEKSDYGKRYESWFNDHLGGRVPLMKLHDRLRNKLSCIIRTEKALYFKENGWVFVLPLVYDLDCRPAFVQSIVKNLVQLNQFCQQNQIKLYVLETPQKEIVYKDFLSRRYGFEEKAFVKTSQVRKTIGKEVSKHHIPYIYPLKALRDAAESDFVFFKWTHHWTDWGAYVGYRELMKEVSKDFPDMPVVSLSDFQKSQNWLIRDLYSENCAFIPTWRQLYQFFNYGDADDPPNRALYSYYDHNNRANMTFKVKKFIKEFSWPEGKHKVMIVGTSHNENFAHFLPFSAAQTKYIRLNGGQVKGVDEFKVLKLYKKNILTFKPDILILSIGSVDLPQLRDLCSTK